MVALPRLPPTHSLVMDILLPPDQAYSCHTRDSGVYCRRNVCWPNRSSGTGADDKRNAGALPLFIVPIMR